MILLREARESDLDALLRFAQIPGMFNLPGDRDTLKDRIEKSRRSFRGEAKNLEDAKYTFIAEEVGTGKILATSMIAGQHGSPNSPHFYFQVGHEKRFSEAINTGFIHGTLALAYDTDGPSEIGALVVDPEFRNHPERIGRQIAFVRFLFAACNRERFKPWVIAELLPPVNKRGQSPLWEAIGRRFTNMDYWEADRLCAKNKDFIFDLFPTGKIYTTFLSAEARNAIGKVGKDTEPVLHMLRKIGFEYRNQIDPFDGGPHLWAELANLTPVKKAKTFFWKGELAEPHEGATGSRDGTGNSTEESGLIYRLRDQDSLDREFKALAIDATIERVPEGPRIGVNKSSKSFPDLRKIEETLSLKNGDEVFFMPYY